MLRSTTNGANRTDRRRRVDAPARSPLTPEPHGRVPLLPRTPRFAVVMLVIVFTMFTVVQFSFPIGTMGAAHLGPARLAGAIIALIMVGLLHLLVIAGLIRQWPIVARLGPVSCVVFAGYLALPSVFGSWWTSLVVFPLFDVVVTNRGRTRVVVATAGVAIFLAVSLPLFPRSESIDFIAAFTVTVLIYLLIPVLLLLMRQLESNRAQLAAEAVNRERLRMARDLHDTLGHSLSVAHMKLELAERIVPRDPCRAEVERAEARSLIRSSIGDMQTVVAGLRSSSLRSEAEGAAAILRSAGIEVELCIDDEQMSEQVAEAMAWVVREGTTNLLRHSDAIHCQIEVRRRGDRTELLFANDGPPLVDPRTPSSGVGLSGLRERLSELGGEFSVRSPSGGGFVLVASAPRWAGQGSS